MSDQFQVLLDAPGTPAREITIARLGDYTDKRYGDFSITAENVANWQKNLSVLPGGRALIDLDHRSERAPRNSEAAGWITGVKLAGDEVKAGVEWTPVGENAIREKRYLFFSPVYGPHKDETGSQVDDVLHSGALTNKPFQTRLPTISLASEETLQAAVDADEDEQHARLLDALSSTQRDNLKSSDFVFPADRRYPIHDLSHARNALARSSGKAEEGAVTAAVYKRYPQLKPGADSRRAMDAQVLKVLGLDEDADEAKILEAVTELKANADKPAETKTLEQQAADEGKVVLEQAEWTALKKGADDGTKALKELAAEKFNAAFEKGVREGRVVPAQRETKEHFYELDAEAALKELAEGPQLVNVTPRGNPSEREEGEAPPGVHPDAHQLHQRILKTLETENLPASKYTEVYNRLTEPN